MLDSSYWENRYMEKDTTWDIGYPSPPLTEYFDKLENKDLKILIPGGGNSYEAEYLINKGFDNVFVIDYSQTAYENFKKRVPEFPASHWFLEDFFAHKGVYDIVVEQTFFCSLFPELRPEYAKQCYSLLNKGGKLIGVLFDDALNSDKPPFGGSKNEYLQYFQNLFFIKSIDKCYNSIQPRKGRELFINLVKK